MPKIYQVGGCVRDNLLGLEPKDHDYVVVGSSVDEMLSLGYKLIEATSFPVFHHPDTREEYALARTERKNGVGYHGFVVNADPSVTLEEDLRRRDLTINAMALDLETNNLVDPFNGKHDLANGILRHVSEAFAEDPLRVLRVARFRARYGFSVATETMNLMTHLVSKGEMLNLTPERVWLELEKGLMEKRPVVFIITLYTCDAWGVLFSKMKIGGGFRALVSACERELCFDGRVAVLLAETSYNDAMEILNKYKAPIETMRLVSHLNTIRPMIDNVRHTPGSVMELFRSVDAFRRPSTFERLLATIRCLNDGIYKRFADQLTEAFMAVKVISFADLSEADQKLTGKAIGTAIDQLRIKKLVDFF